MLRVFGHAKISKAAQLTLINNTIKDQTPKATFEIVDFGLPFQKKETVFIEVQFDKNAAYNLCKYLVKDKEVIIDGLLKFTQYINEQGVKKSKYYIYAENIILPGIK